MEKEVDGSIPPNDLTTILALSRRQVEERAVDALKVYNQERTLEEPQIDEFVANVLLLVKSWSPDHRNFALSLFPRTVAMLSGPKLCQFATEMWKLFTERISSLLEEQRDHITEALIKLIDAVPLPDAQRSQTISAYHKEFLETYLEYLLPFDETTKRTTNQIVGVASVSLYKILEKVLERFWNQLQKLPRFKDMEILTSSTCQYYSLVKIGAGGFSKVYLGFQKHTALPVAIKVIDLDDQRVPLEYKDKYLKPEIEITKSVDHENIIKLHDDIQPTKEDPRMMIIMEYCNSGTLRDIIERLQKQRLSEQEIQGIVRQIAAGCRKLRRQMIFHRDLKPENIMVTKEKAGQIIKIGDFGLSKVAKTKAQFSTKIDSDVYTSPECLFNDKYGIKSDLWSLGVIIYELATGKLPFKSKEEMRNSKAVAKFPTDIKLSSYCTDLIEKLLRINEKDRIPWEVFFVHPFIRENGGLLGLVPNITEAKQGNKDKEKAKGKNDKEAEPLTAASMMTWTPLKKRIYFNIPPKSLPSSQNWPCPALLLFQIHHLTRL